MTYCVGLCLKDGLVFLSDTRTNAGVDQIGTFRKMTLFQIQQDRFFVLLSAGNLAVTQAVKEMLLQGKVLNGNNLWNVKNCHDAALVVGEAIKEVYERDHQALEKAGIDFNCNLIFGGQIKGEKPRLFNVYSAGNFIEATPETCYFQIGESKYGKPILDRVVTYSTSLNLATKCVLTSMDSTLNSNISVGLPLDLLIYENNSLKPSKLITIDESNPYFGMIHQVWGEKLRSVLMSIPEPSWGNSGKALSINVLAIKLSEVQVNILKKKPVVNQSSKKLKPKKIRSVKA